MTSDKGVIFDWDETLINSFDTAFFEFNLVAERLNLRRPKIEEFSMHWGKPLHMFIHMIWPDANIESIANVLTEVSSTVRNPEFKENAHEVLDLLASKGFKLALVSSRSKEHFPWDDPIMEKFDVIVTVEDTKFHKPDPGVFDKVFEKWKDIDRKDIYYVGDVIMDFEAAKKAGINFICFLNEKIHSEQEFIESGVDKKNIMRDLMEIEKIIS